MKNLKKYLEMYQKRLCSMDFAAQKVGITVNEMMMEASKVGIKSTESIEEYKLGLELLR